MTDATLSLAAAPAYEGTNRLILGNCPGGRYLLALCPDDLERRADHARRPALTNSESNIAVSITALFSGIFIVVAGGLADQFDANISRPIWQRSTGTNR